MTDAWRELPPIDPHYRASFREFTWFLGQIDPFSRLLVEQYPRLSLPDLRRWGVLDGTVCRVDWSDGSAATVARIEDSLHVRYQARPNPHPIEVTQRVDLTWSPAGFGGVRPWLVCPGSSCGRRVAVLVGFGSIACRKCAGLAYASTHRTPGWGPRRVSVERVRKNPGRNLR